MANDFKALIGIAYDLKQAQTELDRQVKSLQKNTKLALDIKLSDKEAKKVLQDSSKMWSNYRKEAVQAMTAPNAELQKMAKYYNNLEKQSNSFSSKNINAIDLEIKKREESSKIFSRQIKAQMQERIDAENKVAKANQNALNLESGKTQFSNNISAYLRENTKLGTELRNKLLEIQSSIKTADKTKLDNLKNQFKEVTSSANALGKTGRSVSDELKNNLFKVANWISITTVFFTVTRSIGNMVEEVKAVNSSMVDLKKVTNEVDSTYDKFLTNTAQKAKELGSSMSDLIESTADFARLGYNLKDASSLAQVATLYKNVGDGIDIKDSTESIISTLKAFNIQAKDSISIVDKLNEVGNNFAISSSGIGTALQKSASAMASANNTLDESIALITAGNNVVQDPEAVGTALKTVSLRLRATSADIESMGEDADGAAKTVSKLRDTLLALTKNKVDIQIDKDTYASTYDIMLKMSKVLKDMTDKEQASALELMFGKRQANIGASILANMSDAQNALKTSIESSGSAMREQEKYQQGIQYSTDRLKASLQELSTVTLDSSVIKFFVDFSNGIVNATTAVGGLVPVLATLGTAFAVHKIILPILVKDMSELIVAEGGATATTLSQIVAQAGLNGTIAVGTKAIKANIAAIATWMATNPIGWILGIVGASVGLLAIQDKLTTSLKENQQALSQVQTEYDTETSNVKSLEDQLASCQTQLEELNSIGGAKVANDEQKSKLEGQTQELQNQLTIAKELQRVKGLDAENLAVKTLSTKVKSRYQTSMQPSYEGVMLEQPDYVTRDVELQNAMDAYDKYKQAVESANKAQVEMAKSGKYTKEEWDTQQKIIDKNSKSMENARGYAAKLSGEMQNERKSLIGATDAGSNLSTIVDNSATRYTAWVESLDNTTNSTNKLTEAQQKASDQNNESAKSMYSLATAIDTTSKYINDLGENVDISKLQDAISNAISSAEDYKSILDDIKKNKGISSDNIETITSKYPQLLQYIGNEKALRQELQKGIESQRKSATDYYKDILSLDSQYYTKVLTNHKDLIKEFQKDFNINLKDFKSLAEAKYSVDAQLVNKLSNLWSKYYNAQLLVKDVQAQANKNISWIPDAFENNVDQTAINNAKKQQAQASKAYENYKKQVEAAKKSFESIDTNLNLDTSKIGSKIGNSSTSSKSSSTTDANKEAFNKSLDTLKHNLAMEKITETQYYNSLEDLYKKHFSNKKKYLDEYRQYEEEVFKGRQQLADEAEQARIDKIKAGFDKVNESISKYDDTLSEINSYNGLVDKNSIESLTLLQTGYKVASEKADALNKEITKLNVQYAKGKIDENLYTEQLDKLTGQLFDTSSAMQSYINSIQDAMKARYDTQTDEINKAQQAELDALQKTHDATIDSLNKQLEKRKEIVDAQKKSLQVTEDEYQYQKKISDHTKTISDIQKELADVNKAAETGDREAMARKEQLESDLAKAKTDLTDTQHDHEVDLQQKSIDDYYDSYEKMMKNQINSMEDYYTNEKAQIESTYKTKLELNQSVYENEKKLIQEAADLTKNSFSDAYSTISQMVSNYGLSVSTNFTDAFTGTNTNNAVSALIGEKGSHQTIYSKNSGASDLNKYLASQGYKTFSYNEEGIVELAKALGVSGIEKSSDVNNTKEGKLNKDRILAALKRAGFSSGGEVIANTPNSLIKLLTGEDALAAVSNKEHIFTEKGSNTLEDMLNNIAPKLNTLFKYNVPDISNIVTNKNSVPNISFAIQIDGNADSNTVTKLKSASNDIVKQIMGEVRKL